MGSWGPGHYSNVKKKWGHCRDCRRLQLEKVPWVQASPAKPLEMELADWGRSQRALPWPSWVTSPDVNTQ